jgi:hypothetical protein
VTRSPHNELGSKIWKKKESLHEELNSEIWGTWLDIQVMKMVIEVT